jgi:hypothetical protein
VITTALAHIAAATVKAGNTRQARSGPRSARREMAANNRIGLTDLPPAQVDAAWDALRSWDEAGFRQSTSMGWGWQRGQVTDPDAVAWQYLVVAVVTRWTVAVGTRIEDAEQQGVPPGRLRRAPPTTGAPPRRRWSGPAQPVISLLRPGLQHLRWVLAHGRCWVRVWLRPEPVPKIGDSITMHIYDPSQCLKSP